MREIKFQAMTIQGEWKQYSLGDLVCVDAIIRDGLEFESDTWRQYTGLKDANGVEIYEGDVVDDHVGRGVVKYSNKHGAFRVSYGDGLAKWFYDYILNGERESIEVIGNIHEHKHLLD